MVQICVNTCHLQISGSQTARHAKTVNKGIATNCIPTRGILIFTVIIRSNRSISHILSCTRFSMNPVMYYPSASKTCEREYRQGYNCLVRPGNRVSCVLNTALPPIAVTNMLLHHKKTLCRRSRRKANSLTSASREYCLILVSFTVLPPTFPTLFYSGKSEYAVPAFTPVTLPRTTLGRQPPLG